MNPYTGQLYEGTREDLQKVKDEGVPLMPIRRRDLEKVKAMTKDERIAYAKRIKEQRRKNKQRRRAERKRRGRR